MSSSRSLLSILCLLLCLPALCLGQGVIQGTSTLYSDPQCLHATTTFGHSTNTQWGALTLSQMLPATTCASNVAAFLPLVHSGVYWCEGLTNTTSPTGLLVGEWFNSTDCGVQSNTEPDQAWSFTINPLLPGICAPAVFYAAASNTTVLFYSKATCNATAAGLPQPASSTGRGGATAATVATAARTAGTGGATAPLPGGGGGATSANNPNQPNGAMRGGGGAAVALPLLLLAATLSLWA